MLDETVEEPMKAAIRAAGAEGDSVGGMLETYGSGNAPRKQWFLRLLREASARGIVIVNVTQCSAGTVEMDETESFTLDEFFTLELITSQNDVTGLIGQYAHGNEPSHHVAYLYALLK